jgi:hypothetical protein
MVSRACFFPLIFPDSHRETRELGAGALGEFLGGLP